jgi:hypothetical protein
MVSHRKRLYEMENGERGVSLVAWHPWVLNKCCILVPNHHLPSWFRKDHPLVRLEAAMHCQTENYRRRRGTIINVLQTDLESNFSEGLAFFFFAFSEPEKQTVSNMLAALIAQLCLRLPRITEGLKALYFGTPKTHP